MKPPSNLNLKSFYVKITISANQNKKLSLLKIQTTSNMDNQHAPDYSDEEHEQEQAQEQEQEDEQDDQYTFPMNNDVKPHSRELKKCGEAGAQLCHAHYIVLFRYFFLVWIFIIITPQRENNIINPPERVYKIASYNNKYIKLARSIKAKLR